MRASSSFSLCDLLLLAFYISGFLLAPCAPASTLLLLFIRLFFSIPFCILSPLRFISLGAFISLYLFLFLFLLFVLHSPCIRAFTFRIISFIIFPFLQSSCCVSLLLLLLVLRLLLSSFHIFAFFSITLFSSSFFYSSD